MCNTSLTGSTTGGGGGRLGNAKCRYNAISCDSLRVELWTLITCNCQTTLNFLFVTTRNQVYYFCNEFSNINRFSLLAFNFFFLVSAGLPSSAGQAEVCPVHILASLERAVNYLVCLLNRLLRLRMSSLLASHTQIPYTSFGNISPALYSPAFGLMKWLQRFQITSPFTFVSLWKLY